MEQPPDTFFEVKGAEIRRRRMDLGMSQATCARTAGISRSYLTELEAGTKQRMRPPTYAGLRAALQIQTHDRSLLTPAEDHRKDPDGRHQGADRTRPDDG